MFVTSAALLSARPLQGHNFKRVRSTRPSSRQPDPIRRRFRRPRSTSTVPRWRRSTTATQPGRSPGPGEINWDGGGSTATHPALTHSPYFSTAAAPTSRRPVSGFVRPPSTASCLDVRQSPPTRQDLPAVQPGAVLQPGRQQRDRSRVLCAGRRTNVPAADRRVRRRLLRVWIGRRTTSATGIASATSTVIEYLDWLDVNIFYRGIVPASPRRCELLSFFGILLSQGREVARVKDHDREQGAKPGRNDTRQRDIVMMDDFLSGEPKALP